MTRIVAALVTVVAVAAGVALGRRRGPVVGVLAFAGVLSAGALGYFVLLTLILPT
jgi:hypothetical protein